MRTENPEVPVRLDQIRRALEGAVPAVFSTCSADGEPNVAFLSQVQYVDDAHVALSYQFFNKTRRNILANPGGHLMVMDPATAQIYRMRLRYLRTEDEGALFERMKAHLEGIASHFGMSGTFRLLGSDLYAVSELEQLPGNVLSAPPVDRNPLAAMRRASDRIAQCGELGRIVDVALDALVEELDVEHAMFLMHDAPARRLYAVGSRGYASSGIGAEVALGEGVIGVCAQARTAIRLGWATQAYRYGRAIRDRVLHDRDGQPLVNEIPYPGLTDPHSQLGVPLIHGGRLYGVLFVESEIDLKFTYDHEDALVALGHQIGAAIAAGHEAGAEIAEEGAPQKPLPGPEGGAPLQVRCYMATHSVFFGDQYVIKGVAGAILWRLLEQYSGNGRTEFSNREIRLDPAIRLPDVVDNLEARLILLRRRLDEQCAGVTLEKCGRGRLRLEVQRKLIMQRVDDQ